MDSLIRLSKNVINALIISAVLSTPVYAKKKQSYTAQNNILATSYVVQDIDTNEIVTEKNKEEIRSIASITKLMTAIVVLDAGQDLSEKIVFYKPAGTTSKLPKGAVVTRADLL
jgi:D-alanyl-D-alanine carboxypeptidase